MKWVFLLISLLPLPTFSAKHESAYQSIEKMIAIMAMARLEIFTAEAKNDFGAIVGISVKTKDELDKEIKSAMQAAKSEKLRQAVKDFYISAESYLDATSANVIVKGTAERDFNAKAKALNLEILLSEK